MPNYIKDLMDNKKYHALFDVVFDEKNNDYVLDIINYFWD